MEEMNHSCFSMFTSEFYASVVFARLENNHLENGNDTQVPNLEIGGQVFW